MRHSDFKIGTEFYTDAGKWRCTDVGTRVIVAISLESRRNIEIDSRGAAQVAFVSNLADLAGPPYGVEEVVFDEYDINGCYPADSGHKS